MRASTATGDPLHADLELALSSAWEAGAALMQAFGEGGEVRYKDPDQPVTAADLEADALLRARLRGARPEDGWLSEETADGPARLERDRVWIVDPLDGTRSFIRGYREFAVSVALAVSGEPVIGVVYNPARSDVCWAVRGGGAYRDRGWQGGRPAGERLRLGPRDGTERPSVLASRTEIVRGEFEAFEAAWTILPLGSTAYKLAAVAAGEGGAFVSRGPKSEWDVAAGGLIVAEAGGLVTDARGDPVRYNRADPGVHGVVAAAPGLHGLIMELIADLPAPRLRQGGTDRGEG
jgi:myo-inositol-1(or 4)-monophosphatase